jgi:hypothetical protein
VQATATLQHVLTRTFHGTVTALSRVRTLASKKDGADRVLVSFADAKVSVAPTSLAFFASVGTKLTVSAPRCR